MTDTKLDNTSDSGSAAQAKKTNHPQAAAQPGTRPTRSSRTSRWVVALLILLLIIAALAGLVWYQQRAMQERDNQLSSQAQQSAQSAQAASSQAAQALSLAQAQASQIGQLQAGLTETQQHMQSLEQALQTLTDSGTDIALVNDVDQLVSIAHQQLLLGGNVSNAIIALETAQARLARANRPGLASLQQAINGDLERLRAVSTVDINRLSSRIDELGRLIDAAPLLIPDEAAPAVAESAASPQRTSPPPAVQAVDPNASWWRRHFTSAGNWTSHAWWTVKQDLAGLVSVRRVDDASALLMSPEQAAGLRDKLRLRLMTAQLALLMKQPDVWETETKAVVQSLQSRYDINAVQGHRALRLALQLADTSIRIELPSVANSQSAIQTLREEHARSSQAGLPENGSETQAAEQGVPAQDESPAAGDEHPAPADDAGADPNSAEPPERVPSDAQHDADSPVESASVFRILQPEV